GPAVPDQRHYLAVYLQQSVRAAQPFPGEHWPVAASARLAGRAADGVRREPRRRHLDRAALLRPRLPGRAPGDLARVLRGVGDRRGGTALSIPLGNPPLPPAGNYHGQPALRDLDVQRLLGPV